MSPKNVVLAVTAALTALIGEALIGEALIGAALLRGAPPSRPTFTNRGTPVVKPGSVDAADLKLVTDRALMIRSTDIVDSPDFNSGPWSFANVIRRAVHRTGYGSADATQTSLTLRQRLSEPMLKPKGTQWFIDNWEQADPGLSLEKAPVRLLAVVNRIDLGRTDNVEAPCAPGQFGGAELRFIYSAATQSIEDHFLSMIVEFVLPCRSPEDFQAMGNEWSGLSKSNNYAHDLESLLGKLTEESDSARLRVISSTDITAWTAAEFHFDPNQWLVERPLARQFGPHSVPTGKCQDGGTPIGKFVGKKLPDILASNYMFPLSSTIGVHYADILPPDQTVSTLTLARGMAGPSGPIPDDQVDQARFSLSVNSCTGCHGVETGTSLHHVNQRLPGGSSQLSAFLTGEAHGQAGDATGLTTYSELPAPKLVADCGPPNPASHNFNDLLRRYAFLTTLVKSKPADLSQLLTPVTAYEVE